MKRKIVSVLLTLVLTLALLPTAAFADSTDNTSLGTTVGACVTCNRPTTMNILEFIKSPIASYDGTYHWVNAQCLSCKTIRQLFPGGDLGKHSGGTETPTCTTGKTCEKCGETYGILGHDWDGGVWQSNNDNKTHTRTCQRTGCGAVDTANCGGDRNATCVALGKCTGCGGQYYGGHAFPEQWNWRSDTEVGRDAEKHWVRCLNCKEGKAYERTHSFSPGREESCLKSEATCISPPVYYVSCGTCLYKGTDTYVDPYGKINPSNHDLEYVSAKEATTREEGNIEHWYCKACRKYFLDAAAMNEIKLADVVIPRLESSGSRFSYSTISASAGSNGKISPSGDLSVRDDLSQTFVFTPDKGYRVKDVLIDGKSVGALRNYTFATVRKNRTVEVIFEKIPAFVDVPAGSYYEDAVNWAVENWITEGTDDTHFSPDAPCTRAQAVTFLWRAAGCPAPASYTMPFADVKSGSYYETAVLWALENGIVSGTSETTFEPDAQCTRAQIVCFLFRYKAANGMDAVTLAELLGGFADSAEIPAYARPALNWALSANVLQGSGAKLLPNEACTRAQIVTLLYRTIR